MKKMGQKQEQENVMAKPLTDSQKQAFIKYFVDSDETIVSSLGNSYIENFIADGTLKNGFSVISDKRVYFRGSCYVGSGKSLVKSDEERVVDLKDVTGSGFIYRRYVGIILSLIIGLLVAVTASVLLILFFPDNTSTYYKEILHTKQKQLNEYGDIAVELDKNPRLAEQIQNEINGIKAKEGLVNKYRNPDYNTRTPGIDAFPSGYYAISNYHQKEIRDLIYEWTKADGNEDISQSTIQHFDELINDIQIVEKVVTNAMNTLDSVEEIFNVTPIGKSKLSYEASDIKDYLQDFFFDDPRLIYEIFEYEELEDFYLSYRNVDAMLSDKYGDSDLLFYIAFAALKDEQHLKNAFLSDVLSKMEMWRDSTQGLVDYINTGASPISDAERKRLRELEEKLTVYQNPQYSIHELEEEVTSLKSSATGEKISNLLYTALSTAAVSIFVGLVVLFAKYLRKRKTYFEINYAGGKIAFNVSLYPKAEIEDFQKQLRRAKDFISIRATQTPAPITVADASTTRTMADELEKYANLLEKGIISQEEFETLKRKALEE